MTTISYCCSQKADGFSLGTWFEAAIPASDFFAEVVSG
jgi:hypothetical protein